MPSNPQETPHYEEEDEDEDLNSSTSSDDPNKFSTLSVVSGTGTATAVGGSTATPPVPPLQPQPITVAKPSLFQRLWTDADEIGLLQGFLDYTTQRVGSANSASSSTYHLDTNLFYDQIKNRLQLDFNKNQLVEKLRRLKKKYRNAVSRMSNGKDFAFKSAHEQAAFEISHKIWSGVGAAGGGPGAGSDVIEDEEFKPNFKNLKSENNNGIERERAVVKRPRREVEEMDDSSIENAVKKCLSPVFKELFSHLVNGGSSAGGLGVGGFALDSVPLGIGGSGTSGEVMDEKWRKQRILELEVYQKRVELVQDDIKAKLEELKGNSS